VVEIERIIRHGLTKEELAVAKEPFLKELTDQTQVDPAIMTNDLQEFFLKSTPLPDRKAIQEFVKNIEVRDIQNNFKNWIDTDHQQVVITMPQPQEQNPLSQAVLNDWITEARAKTIAPYVAERAKELMNVAALPAAKFSEMYLKEIGTTRLSLSNGIEVLLKPLKSEASENQVRLVALRKRGVSQMDERDISYGIQMVSTSGLGNLNASELRMFLSNRDVQVTPYKEGNAVGITGAGDSGELETMLQLVNRYFIAPRGDENVFNDLMQRAEKLGAAIRDPQDQFEDAINASVNPPAPPDQGNTEHLTFQCVYDSYKKYFGNPGEFDFVMTGDFNVVEVKPLVAKYLGNLPVAKKIAVVKKTEENTFMKKKFEIDQTTYGASASKVQVQLILSGTYEYTSKNNVKLSVLGKALQSVLWTRLREKDGYVYGIFVATGLSKDLNKYSFSVNFSCDPAKVDKCISSVRDELEKLKAEPIADNIFEKIILQEKGMLERKLNDSDYWAQYLANQMRDEADLEEIMLYEKWIGEITPDIMDKTAKKYLENVNMYKFILMPAQSNLMK
jgi:zinc protease